MRVTQHHIQSSSEKQRGLITYKGAESECGLLGTWGTYCNEFRIVKLLLYRCL